jgi:hypothetical protein
MMLSQLFRSEIAKVLHVINIVPSEGSLGAVEVFKILVKDEVAPIVNSLSTTP